jgi:hypothetical protein
MLIAVSSCTLAAIIPKAVHSYMQLHLATLHPQYVTTT